MLGPASSQRARDEGGGSEGPMRPKKARSSSAPRFVFGLLVLAAWSAGTILLARTGVLALAIVAGVLFTVPLTSFGEWLVHGVLYHGRVPGLEFIRTIHHHGHHFALFPPNRYVQDG